MRVLSSAGQSEEAWPRLGSAVLTSSDHQSQEATDCRWMKVIALLVSGKLQLGSNEEVLEILEYPRPWRHADGAVEGPGRPRSRSGTQSR